MANETQIVTLDPRPSDEPREPTRVFVAARYDEEETRTFELVEQIFPVNDVPVSEDTGVYVWKAVEIVEVAPGVEGPSLQQFAVKFYNPDRQSQLDIPEEDKADFFFKTEDYMDQQIRGLSPGLAEIVGIGLAKLDDRTPAGQDDAAQGINLRRFAVITTPNNSTDFRVVQNNLILTMEDLGSVPLGMQYLLRVAMAQLCEALDTMHVVGVYHQDIKTENMVLGSTPGWSFEQSVDAWNQIVDDPRYRLGISGFRSDDTPWSRDIDTNVLNLAGSIGLEMLKIIAGVVPDGTTLADTDLLSTPKRRERPDSPGPDEDDPESKRRQLLSVRVGEETSGEELRDVLGIIKRTEFERVLGFLVPWAVAMEGSLVAMLIDFDRGRSMNAIFDMSTVGVDGTISTLDPWRVITDGNPDLYDFGPSTPQQQLRAAFHGSDLWSMGITMFEMANLFNPFDSTVSGDVRAAFPDSVPRVNLENIVDLVVGSNNAQGLDLPTFERVCRQFARLGTGSLEPSVLIDPTMGWDVIRPLLSFRVSDRYETPMKVIVEGLRLAPTQG